ARQASTSVAQTPQRDAQAILLVTNAVAAMGGTSPKDSTATGAIQIVEGSTARTGTIRVLTSGTEQTREEITTGEGVEYTVYSRGRASAKKPGADETKESLELAQSSQAAEFPLPFLAGLLSNSDVSIIYVGFETADARSFYHIRFSNTFSSAAQIMQGLADFSVRDLWLDAASGLPAKLSFDRRFGEGSTPHIPVEITYEDYRLVNGILYPYQISIARNGTPWASISIQDVSINIGLDSANFQVLK